MLFEEPFYIRYLSHDKFEIVKSQLANGNIMSFHKLDSLRLDYSSKCLEIRCRRAYNEESMIWHYWVTNDERRRILKNLGKTFTGKVYDPSDIPKMTFKVTTEGYAPKVYKVNNETTEYKYPGTFKNDRPKERVMPTSFRVQPSRF